MNGLLMLIPLALALGGLGLIAFLWALRSGQFEDLDGAAHRILFHDEASSGLPRSGSVGKRELELKKENEHGSREKGESK